MNITLSKLTVIGDYLRTHGMKAGREVLANFILPFLVYRYANEKLGAAPALIAASAPPTIWAIIRFFRQRRVDAISIIVLAGIVLSLLAFVGGGGVKFLQLRENLVAGVVGLVFLGSAAIGRPLIYQLARAGVRRRAPDRVALVEALRRDAGFRAAMMTATLVWGVGLMAECAAQCALVFMVSITQFLLISGPISYSTIGLLTAWTFWYVPRAIRSAAARQAAGQETESTA